MGLKGKGNKVRVVWLHKFTLIRLDHLLLLLVKAHCLFQLPLEPIHCLSLLYSLLLSSAISLVCLKFLLVLLLIRLIVSIGLRVLLLGSKVVVVGPILAIYRM